jgi:ATPase subunit of ABC transporter with duplicated ATPase domains
MGQYPEEIAAEWGLPASVFDRPWTTLSGGEAQRASLAIALSSEPRVLLLDEVTAGLDEATEQLVEKSLAACGLPIIMVTHSSEQLHRFCTHHISI